MSAPQTQIFRVASLDELAADPTLTVNGRKIVERVPYLPAVTFDQPALEFGTPQAFDQPGTDQTPALGSGALHVERPAVPAYIVRDANVFAKYGIILIGDRVVEETLYHAPLYRIPGAAGLGDRMLQLPLRPLSVKLPTAYHMLAGNLDNYFHWLIDALTRFDPELMRQLGPGPEADGAPVLLVPELDQFWKWESLALLVPRDVPRIALVEDSMLFVQRLVFLPNLSGGGFLPHPRLVAQFDQMRAAIGPTQPPHRRIYVARSDSRSRVLLNEGEIVGRVTRAGFTPVLLSAMSVAEQVRLFAEATHVIGAHGAGLTNLMFCHPGAALLELHMDRYVQWAYRRLAMLRGVRYGAVLGQAVGPRQEWLHAQAWRLDPAHVDAALADPAFLGA